ncbi:unnamed protein product [Rhizoctonia solani]|uniref:SGT1-domain-containing protein n=1 Tax=Rhizoctonia solani TaxID=456999 RepID=A0A8H3BN05_9AGAM|nr:unnamed protein product [Rhizoctonia solani]
MDIFKLAPQVAEDTLEYSLYPRNYDESPAALRTLILQYVAGLLPANFLWHRDSFEIIVQYPDQGSSKPVLNTIKWNLYGRMRVGDCVDDEWCAVWLLREISKKWDLAVSVHDTDGEFLLIEAADVLPAWITPENAENRVWIYRGHLHIIPLSYISSSSTRPTQRNLNDDLDAQASIDEYLSVPDALVLVFGDDTATHADASVEQAAWNRVLKYPTALSQHIHRAKAYLPIDVARALSVDPPLVQRAVEAFYTRDGLQLRAAQRMARFPPKPDVLRMVSMTRPAYAQLVGQVFHPPKVFGTWQELQGSAESRWRDIGMKIACGFEMMYAESKSQTKALTGNSTESREARIDALRRDEGYNTYIQSLTKAGYFAGELAGSQLYKDREQIAADKYVELRTKGDTSRPSFAAQVEEAVKLSSEHPSSSSDEEDSTEWLQIDESTFDGMLKQKFSRKDAEQPGEDDEDQYTQEQAAKLQELAKKVEGFVGGKGDLEGAQFEDDILEEDMGPDSDDESNTSEPNEVDRQLAMDRLVPPLEPGDYGQMPASYSNSQSVKPTTLDTERHIPENEEMPELGESTPYAKPSVVDAYKTPTSTPQDTDQQSEQKSREKLLRRPLLPRDRFDGVDSDDDTDPEEEESALNVLPDDGESEEDRPTVVGEVEIDMDNEQEEFIKFSREALGIDDALWSKIIEERKNRGAFIPGSHTKNGASTSASHATKTQSSTGNEMHWLDDTPKQKTPRAPTVGPKAHANPKLDSFEAVMEAMEEELRSSRNKTNTSAKPSALKVPQDKGKGKGVPREEDKKRTSKQVRIAEHDEHGMEDIETAMERELREALNENENSDEDGEVSMDYNLIKNFLESFKGQAGASGPVSNLAGRLQQGWALPRDNGA